MVSTLTRHIPLVIIALFFMFLSYQNLSLFGCIGVYKSLHCGSVATQIICQSYHIKYTVGIPLKKSFLPYVDMLNQYLTFSRNTEA